jgi:hypothetical protein
MIETEKSFSKKYLQSIAIEFLNSNIQKYKIQLSDINRSCKQINSSTKVNKHFESYIDKLNLKIQAISYLLELIDSEDNTTQ